MRTTIDIREDVMIALRQRAQEENKKLTTVVNELLKRSLIDRESATETFVQKTYPLGQHPGINLEKALDLAAELETDYTIRKMEIGK